MRDTIDMAREAFSIVKGESWNSGYWTVAHEELKAFEALVRADERALAAPVQEPIGYLFQHEETGLTQVVDVQQVEWGFEKNNPRHQKIGPVYTTPPAAQPAPVQEPDELKHIGEQDSLLDVDESAWHLLVENRGGCRCHISPPCSACSNPISEEEMNEVGYTYSTPPAAQRPWVGLTNEEIAQIYLVNTDKPLKPEWLFARAIERKLKGKNT